MELRLVAGRGGLGNRILSTRIQKLGLALSGYTGYIKPGRAQFIGGTEIHFLETLNVDARRNAFINLSSHAICCMVITKDLEAPSDLKELCERNNIPLLQTDAASSVAIAEVTDFLEQTLAPQISLHGVLMDIYGMGVLLCGDSGVGKSECALDLIFRGHRLISDDLICIVRHGPDRLVGKGPENLRFHMELRGLGIIDIKELFGISVLREEKNIELAIRFETWSTETEFDRSGCEQETMEILGIHVPLRRMPVAPGRNLATLVEVAARLQLLKTRRTSVEG
jgi:HPr kinase/phosphorylase